MNLMQVATLMHHLAIVAEYNGFDAFALHSLKTNRESVNLR